MRSRRLTILTKRSGMKCSTASEVPSKLQKYKVFKIPELNVSLLEFCGMLILAASVQRTSFGRPASLSSTQNR
jgi:hypothetical protein